IPLMLWKLFQQTSYNNLTKEREQLQTRYKILIEERDQQQTSYNNLTKERDQLHSSYNNLTKERDQLQTRCKTLSEERDQLQTRYNNLIEEGDQQQTSYNNLTKEREQLQTRYKILIEERDQQQTSYNNLTKERDQLHSSYNNLTKERDQLQTRCKTLSEERDQLQTSNNNLTKERDQLQRDRDIFQRLLVKCPNGWKVFGNRSYYVSTEKNNWEYANQDCLKRGAQLVIINNQEEQKFLITLNIRSWIGLTDRETEGTWKWVDNTTLTTVYWGDREPNNGDGKNGEEDCAEINSWYSDPVKKWNDFSCTTVLNWICEKVIY
uniref:C-type lectin domain-containing protein n=1 Tax=Esox lucius TaxID=8010 RepID=A0A3P8Y5V8_ESOLU